MRRVGTPERVEVEPVGEAEFVAVASDTSDTSDQRRLGDQAAALTREQIECAGITTAISEPVLKYERCPSPDGQHTTGLGRRRAARFPIANLADAEAAKLASMRVASKVDRLKVPQFVEPQAVAVCDLDHHSVSIGSLPTL